MGSLLQQVGFSPVVVHHLNCPSACGMLVPRPGIEPSSPASAGRLLTSDPPGKSLACLSIPISYYSSIRPWSPSKLDRSRGYTHVNQGFLLGSTQNTCFPCYSLHKGFPGLSLPLRPTLGFHTICGCPQAKSKVHVEGTVQKQRHWEAGSTQALSVTTYRTGPGPRDADLPLLTPSPFQENQPEPSFTFKP